MINEKDSIFLRKAIRLSAKNSHDGIHGPFGAVITLNDEVIAEGWNEVLQTNDPTSHAEIVAIRKACRKLNSWDLSGTVLYSSCEPCPMCMGAIYWSRISRVVFAADRKDAAEAGFSDDMIYEEINIPHDRRSIKFVQHLQDEAVEVFLKWMENPERKIY